MRSLVILLVLLGSASCYAQDRYYPGSYKRYGSNPYSRYATNPPKIYGNDGAYLGELSTNRYRSDSVSNPYGRYGSRYSSDSVNNPYGPYGTYSTRPIWVYPGR